MKKWINNSLYGFGGMMLGLTMAVVAEEPVEPVAASEPVAEVVKTEQAVEAPKAKPEAVKPKPVEPKAVEPKAAPVAKAAPVKPVSNESAKAVEPVQKPKPKAVVLEGIGSAAAKTACNEIIKDQTKNFDKVKIHYLTDAVFIKDASGRANASIGFTINNGQGVNLPYVGYCYFNPDESLRTFEIQEGNR